MRHGRELFYFCGQMRPTTCEPEVRPPTARDVRRALGSLDDARQGECRLANPCSCTSCAELALGKIEMRHAGIRQRFHHVVRLLTPRSRLRPEFTPTCPRSVVTASGCH